MSEPVPLSRATLGRLPAAVRPPAYDPAEVRAGIVHLGFGGFHRAHMARYLHDLMTLRPDAREWGVVGVGLLPADVRVRDALAPQDGLYTLVERQDEDEDATVIGSVHSVVFAGESSRAALERIDDPAVRIVSLTVTEYGYCLDAAKGCCQTKRNLSPLGRRGPYPGLRQAARVRHSARAAERRSL